MTKHVAKRPRTINSKSFYGTAARVGGKVAKYAAQRYIKHKVSNAGKRLFNTARKVTARFLKSRSNSDKRSLPDIIQQGSQHFTNSNILSYITQFITFNSKSIDRHSSKSIFLGSQYTNPSITWSTSISISCN